MSDGPFKSPLGKKCWQPVADRAANESFSVREVREAVPAALAREFGELPDGFKRGLERVFLASDSGRLIDPRESGEMERLRAEAAGHSLAMLALDCIEDAMDQGKRPSEALIDGTAAALEQCYGENARSIEEHAQRDRLGEAVTQSIRRRLMEASPSSSDLDVVARGLWKLALERVPRTPPKHRDLGDGPPLAGGPDE
jgi:hypothetical protein